MTAFNSLDKFIPSLIALVAGAGFLIRRKTIVRKFMESHQKIWGRIVGLKGTQSRTTELFANVFFLVFGFGLLFCGAVLLAEVILAIFC